MCRVRKYDDVSWHEIEIWIADGTYNIERKRWNRKGYDIKPSIVKKEVSNV